MKKKRNKGKQQKPKNRDYFRKTRKRSQIIRNIEKMVVLSFIFLVNLRWKRTVHHPLRHRSESMMRWLRREGKLAPKISPISIILLILEPVIQAEMTELRRSRSWTLVLALSCIVCWIVDTFSRWTAVLVRVKKYWAIQLWFLPWQ